MLQNLIKKKWLSQITKYPTYKRHWISWCVRKVAPIPKIREKKEEKLTTCHVSPDRCHMSPVTFCLSTVTCHLTNTLCSFTCYESPRTLGDAAVGGLMIDRVIKNRQCRLYDESYWEETKQQTMRHMDFGTYRLNPPRGWLSEDYTFSGYCFNKKSNNTEKKRKKKTYGRPLNL